MFCIKKSYSMLHKTAALTAPSTLIVGVKGDSFASRICHEDDQTLWDKTWERHPDAQKGLFPPTKTSWRDTIRDTLSTVRTGHYT